MILSFFFLLLLLLLLLKFNIFLFFIEKKESTIKKLNKLISQNKKISDLNIQFRIIKRKV